MLRTTLWQHAKMSTTLKAPDRLKDSECKKGQLSNWPPVPYVPPTDLVTTKEEPQSLKIKLPGGSVFNMSINSHHGSTKGYLAHLVAVLHIIMQKRLDLQCRLLGKAIVKLTGTFKDLLKADGSKGTVSSDDVVEACKLEIEETQKMLQEAQKQHNQDNPQDVQALEEPPIQ
jgi:hypothetical protein